MSALSIFFETFINILEYFFKYHIYLFFIIIGILFFIIDAINQKTIKPKTVGKNIIGYTIIMLISFCMFFFSLVDFHTHTDIGDGDYIEISDTERAIVNVSNTLEDITIFLLKNIMTLLSFISIIIIFVAIIKIIIKYAKQKILFDSKENKLFLIALTLDLFAMLIFVILCSLVYI